MEFQRLIEYLCPSISIPHNDAIHRLIMEFGEETIEGTKKMVEVYNSCSSLFE